MTILQKLSEARRRFKDENVQKSGENKFQGYRYFELSDILNTVVPINAELGILTVETITESTATLSVYNTDDASDKVDFSVPMGTAQLKGCHPVQNLGAAISYVRRYLYQNAYSVAEPDQLDSGKQSQAEVKDKTGLVKETQRLSRLANFTKSVKAVHGWETVLAKHGYSEPEEVPEEMWKTVWKELNNDH